ELRAVRSALLEAMQADKAHIDRYLQMSLDLAAKALEEEGKPERDYVVAGETQLIGSAGPEELERLRDLFEAFQRKRDILDLVDRCIQAEGVQIFIGEEAGYEVFGGFSVVTAPY